MRMNKRMKELYRSLDPVQTASKTSLGTGLLGLLDAGFKQTQGALLLRAQEKLARNVKPENFPDLTGYETFVNHIHVEEYVSGADLGSDPMKTLKYGVAFAHSILEKLVSSFPGKPFTVILACNESGCSVRFHVTRRGEQWLSDNLEAYEQEALLVLETPPSSLSTPF